MKRLGFQPKEEGSAANIFVSDYVKLVNKERDYDAIVADTAANSNIPHSTKTTVDFNLKGTHDTTFPIAFSSQQVSGIETDEPLLKKITNEVAKIHNIPLTFQRVESARKLYGIKFNFPPKISFVIVLSSSLKRKLKILKAISLI